MGNACSCMRSSSSSSSLLHVLDLSAEFTNRLRNEFRKEDVDRLISRMDQLIHNLNAGAQAQTDAPNQPSASSPSSSSAVSAATGTASQIVKTLSHSIERETPKRKCCGTETLKRCGMAALDSHTAKFVSEVLGKIENVPYVGIAASFVVFALEHVHQTSANKELRLRLMEHMSALVKHMNSVHDPHLREKFRDIILFILKITISIFNQIQSPSVSRLAFAYPDAADLQEMEKEFNNRHGELRLDILLSIAQNVPQVVPPSVGSYSPTAVGIEDAMEEVKGKLKVGEESRRVVAISGIGGIGKTTLAEAVVNSLSSEIEDAYAYCRLSLDMDIKSTDIVRLQQQLLRNAFNWNVDVQSSSDGKTKILQTIRRDAHASSSKTSKPLFLFIDNALKEDDVGELLPIDGLSLLPLRSRILVTTRNLNKIQALMKIKGFDSEEYRVPENRKAKKMLCHYVLGNQDSAFPEDVEVEGLLEICGGIPLVIRIAATMLRKFADMARSCKDITVNIRRMRDEGWEDEVSHRMVDFVYGQLPVPAKRVLHDIAFFYVGWFREEAEYMLEAPTFIQELKDAALLSEDERGRLQMHDIIRERSQTLSKGEGHRISGKESWDMAKADPETWKTIKGVQLYDMFMEVTQHDFDVITKCTGITTLILSSAPYVEPLKLHLWPSLRIVYLSGPIIVDVDQLSPTNLVTLKFHNVKVEDTPKFYQRIGHFHNLCCLELVELVDVRGELGSFREVSSLKRLRLTSYSSQRLPEGFENLVALQSLKLDDCRNLCQLPQGLGKCSHLKELDLSGCSMLEKAADSWQHLTSLQQLSMRRCKSLKFISEDIGRLLKLKTLNISGCEMLPKLPNSFGNLSSLEFLT